MCDNFGVGIKGYVVGRIADMVIVELGQKMEAGCSAFGAVVETAGIVVAHGSCSPSPTPLYYVHSNAICRCALHSFVYLLACSCLFFSLFSICSVALVVLYVLNQKTQKDVLFVCLFFFLIKKTKNIFFCFLFVCVLLHF